MRRGKNVMLMCLVWCLSVFLRECSHVEAAQDLIYHLAVMKELYLNSENGKLGAS